MSELVFAFIFILSPFIIYFAIGGSIRFMFSLAKKRKEKIYKNLEAKALNDLGFSDWNIVSYFDNFVSVQSTRSVHNYSEKDFFRETPQTLQQAPNILAQKSKIANTLKKFLITNAYKQHTQYPRLENQIKKVITNASAYRISVNYISPSGRNWTKKEISLTLHDINKLIKDPTLLMTKVEYNQYLKKQQQEALTKKQHAYYERVNNIIDFASKIKSSLFIKGSVEQMNILIVHLFDRSVNNIQKIKNVDSEDWTMMDSFISNIETEMKNLVQKNQKFLDYYESSDFLKIKETCKALTSTQREFNEYIAEKVESVSHLFGTRIIRNETVNEDEYQYLRPYQKEITPFTAEVSAAVFASAENSPLDYVIKNFYPDKAIYPEQIQKLHLLIEELETLKEAKLIIDNYKAEYQQYLNNVPNWVMEEDEVGFYSRLGFASIDESALVVEYKFSYTSGGGMAKRTFSVPMTEETIVELIQALEGKLTLKAFSKEQRALMTSKLRNFIKTRDNFTCCCCGNSTHTEPNLLLEIDHIIPISKGGHTKENNLQTLCWKCNRAKSNKLA